MRFCFPCVYYVGCLLTNFNIWKHTKKRPTNFDFVNFKNCNGMKLWTMCQIEVKICDVKIKRSIRAYNVFGSYCFSQRYDWNAEIHLIRNQQQMLNRHQFDFVRYFTPVFRSTSFARFTLIQSEFITTNVQFYQISQMQVFLKWEEKKISGRWPWWWHRNYRTKMYMKYNNKRQNRRIIQSSISYWKWVK